MPITYLHGIETVELQSPAGPVETVKSNVIGLIGTAPDADATAFPLNTPVAVFSDATLYRKLGRAGTLFDAVEAIYSQKAAVIVVVRVANDASEATVWANMVGSVTDKTGIWAFLKARPTLRVTPKILVAPGYTSNRATNGVASVTVGTAGTGYTSSATVAFSASPAGAAATATGKLTIVGGAITGVTIVNKGFGYVTAPTITITPTGGGTGGALTAVLGTAPNPVGMALASIVDRLRAVAFVDGPGTTYAAAVQARNDYGSQRVMMIDPGVLKFDTGTAAYVTRPASAYAAALQARIDDEKGFWYSLSNELIQNIGGPSRPVDWALNDTASEANNLNAAQVTTIIHDDGFRFWGLRGMGSDPLWAQLSVRRTADMIYESLERAHRHRMDKPFSYPLLYNIKSDVNRYLKLLKTRGALIDGKGKIDPNSNTAATFSAGILTVDFDLEPPACLEHLIFQAVRNPDYYNDFIETFSTTLLNA